MKKMIGAVNMISNIYLLLLIMIVFQFSFTTSKLQNNELQINDCENLEFRCANGRCIAKQFVCDGLSDCADGSDETLDQCHNTSCNENSFQCQYGACIDKSYKCDGLKQCLDGSDEYSEICEYEAKKIKSIRNRRAVDKSCAAPPSSIDKNITFFCADDSSQLCSPVNGLVPFLTIALMKCTSGYYDEKVYNEEEENDSDFICHNKKWRPRIRKCVKICEKLNPVNVDLQCNRNGMSIPCDGDSILLAGTKIRPSCKPTHKYSSNSPPDYLEMTCNNNGKWDNALFSCIPECGRTYTNAKLLVKGGVRERFGDSPWHVAIFDRQKILICGGTIISPHMVISAAHCFHEQENSVNITNIKNYYEVVVGKVSRDYHTKDNEIQKVHKIKDIRFSKKGYFGVINNYESDIVILILQEKINISSTVLPACIQWIGLRDGKHPEEDTEGKVSGWGLNEHGKYSEFLTTTNLPFISHIRCLQIVPDDFKRFVTFDKFCAGSENGTGVLQGDSGGGLLFKENNFYYLQGVVSLKQPTSTGIAAFTDLGEHINWISTVRSEVEAELNKKPSGGTHKIDDKTTTTTAKIPTITKNGSIEFPKNTPATGPLMKPTTETPITASAMIALNNCEIYTQYRYVKKWHPKMANKPGYWQNVTDCVNVMTLIKGGVEAKPKEYPHMAVLGYGKDLKHVEWGCGGSLISEKFILTAGHCGKPAEMEEPRWVMLGDLEISSKKKNSNQAVYEIKKVHIHPNYSKESHYHDISLIELNTTVQMSPYVRPACLYTSPFISANTTGYITGWGRTDIWGQRSNNLLKATISIFEDRQCTILYNNTDPRGKIGLEQGYSSNSMICAGDLNDEKDICAGDSGGPLQIPIREQFCMWNIIGITSFGGICRKIEAPDPGVYTKVSFYLDWIQTIVWP